MIPNPHSWENYIREIFLPEIEALDKTIQERIPKAFEGIKEEAEQVKNEAYNQLGKFAGEDTDGSDFFEQALDEGIVYFDTMENIQQGINNLFAVALYHIFEQHLLIIHRRELLPKEDENNSNKFQVNNVAHTLSKNFGLDIESFRSYSTIYDELRLVANTVKHSDGDAADELKKLRPDMFSHPVVRASSEGSLSEPGQVFEPLFGRDFYVTLDDLTIYFESVKDFWEEFCEYLLSDENG